MRPAPLNDERRRPIRVFEQVATWSRGTLVILCGFWLMSGCKSPAPTIATDAGGHGSSESLTAEQTARVLAKIGDRTLTVGDYVATLEHMDPFDRLRYQSPERRKELLDEMINVELLADEATAKGYDKDPVTQQEMRAILRDAMLALARKDAPAPADIPESEARAYYDAHRADYRDPERRRVSCIVLRDEKSAREVLARLAENSTWARWGDLVRTTSIDAQARSNVPADLAGDFGFVSPPGDSRGENSRVPEEVRHAAFAIAEVGGLSAVPVAAGGKQYVVRLSQKSDARERTFPEAERSIRLRMAQERVRAREDELLAKLREEFPVRIDEAALGSVRVAP